MSKTISNTDDTIDLRAIIERVEELRDEREEHNDSHPATPWETIHGDEAEELATLESLLSDLAGNGGDEQWEGNWYPLVLIRDSYFKDHAQELAEDIGAVNHDATWPNNCIDWDQAARELRQDYNAVKFDGITYWCR